MDSETEKYFSAKLHAVLLRHHETAIELQKLAEEFSNATGKKPSDIVNEEKFDMSWPAHLKPPKKNGNGNGNGRHH